MATKGATKEKTNDMVHKPKRYKVIMHNDDFTTMDFVVEILIEIFHKNQLEAENLMMCVHRQGSAVVGVYPLDIARTKINDATNLAKQEGFPFKLTMEEA
ncbi:ATP-dependent Clp protease adaptor protein ClpS [Acetitomaculum ruminis DSM 5522]|uniref:ATP-dependent Clp protease adapter protein ClpS n=1 Tax=Acetitomaculum ruminis DSM 5522 TaxID=1120918 RepID=A0A1I0ZS08_9FIRM|nr:ATP-dependent Clp protease adaptor ClpS [Acetitomaculum ruminis]SFB27118.1 ATP-dependent Clp protease adaptor protein ClpS [Acetitomaculum ruminis DSM 5522]